MSKKPTSPGTVRVRLAWGTNPELDTIHAHHVWLSRSEDDAYLTFGEVPPVSPSLDTPPEELVIRPVARVSLSWTALERMTKMLRDNVPVPENDGARGAP